MANRVYCTLPFETVKVSLDGNLRMCCHQNQLLGNLTKNTLEEIWQGKLAQEIRREVLAGRIHAACSETGRCPFLYGPRELYSAEENPYPVCLEIDLPNTHCNIGGTEPTPETVCLMCPRGDPGFVRDDEKSLRSDQVLTALRPIMPGLRELTVSGLSEPLWRDKLFEMLELLDFDRHKEHCELRFFTNGTLLNSERRQKLRAYKGIISVSVDAATPETYRAIRRLDLFDRVLENVAAFARERGPHQVLHMTNNLNTMNLREAMGMLRLGKELGVDLVAFNPTHDLEGRLTTLRGLTVNEENCAQFYDVQCRLVEESHRIRMPVYFHRPLDLGLTKRKPPATFPINYTRRGPIHGTFEIERGQIKGWAWNSERPDEPCAVQICLNGRPFRTVIADKFRADLLAGGYGSGRCGYDFLLPDEVLRVNDVVLSAAVRGFVGELSGSPAALPAL